MCKPFFKKAIILSYIEKGLFLNINRRKFKKAKVRRLSERDQGYIKTIEQQLAKWLETIEADSLVGTVHSIFNSVVNILSVDQNSLLTIALDDVVSSPWMMKTTDNYLFNKMKNQIVPGDIKQNGNTIKQFIVL